MVGHRTPEQGRQLETAGLGQSEFEQLPQTPMAPEIGMDDGGADFGQGGRFSWKKTGRHVRPAHPGKRLATSDRRLPSALSGDEPFGIVEVLKRIGIAVGPVQKADYGLGIRRGEGPQFKGLGFAGGRAGRRVGGVTGQTSVSAGSWTPQSI